jgi:hypothetical protein
MPIDEQLKASFQMGQRDLASKPDTSAHMECGVSGDNLFEREETTLSHAGRQSERLSRRLGCGKNIVDSVNRDRWRYRCGGRS